VIESPTANNGTDTVHNADSFTYKVTDTLGNSTTGTIYVDIKDDVPTAHDHITSINSNSHSAGTNLLLIIDTSGSDGVSPQELPDMRQKLLLEQAALENLINDYGQHGNVMVNPRDLQ